MKDRLWDTEPPYGSNSLCEVSYVNIGFNRKLVFLFLKKK